MEGVLDFQMERELIKYCALGNDYFVVDAEVYPIVPDREWVAQVCNRHEGVGSDGILYGPLPSEKGDCAVKIFNSDGSEAEKSGNGLTIFAQYLRDRQFFSGNLLKIETMSGVVTCEISADGLIQLDMGEIKMLREVHLKPSVQMLLNEFFGQTINPQCYFLSLGNPHCVVPVPKVIPELAKVLGPLIENDELFPERTNVQFLEIFDQQSAKIEIWERGSGYTLGSGSSACAAAYVAYLLTGSLSPVMNVQMPGGKLTVEFLPGNQVRMWNRARRIAKCTLEA